MSQSQLETVAAGSAGKVPFPTYVQIEPVGQCNLKCTMCPINFRDDKPLIGKTKMMDYTLFTRIVDQFTNLEVLHLQGVGEPLLHPRFFEMVSYAVQKGIRVTTNTNLTLVNEERAEKCVTSGLDTLHFSIDGTTRETYEKIRVNANFDKVLANLETLISTRKRMGSATPHLHMVMVIMKQNLAELPDLVRLASRFGAEEVFAQQLSHDFGDTAFHPKYQPLHNYVNRESLLYENPERVEHYFGQARELAKELGVNLRLPRTQPRQISPETTGRQRCSWPWTGAYVSFQGYAMPCCMVASPEQMNMGLIKEDNLDEVWNGEAYQRFRAQLDAGQPHEICRQCSIYNGVF